MALIFSSSKDMTHIHVLQCLSGIGNYLKLPFSGVFMCLCVCMCVLAGWSSRSRGAKVATIICPLCRGDILGNNGGIALVVGWYPVQWVPSGYYPPAIRLSTSQIWRCDLE